MEQGSVQAEGFLQGDAAAAKHEVHPYLQWIEDFAQKR
jgi:hypothetical protein